MGLQAGRVGTRSAILRNIFYSDYLLRSGIQESPASVLQQLPAISHFLLIQRVISFPLREMKLSKFEGLSLVNQKMAL